MSLDPGPGVDETADTYGRSRPIALATSAANWLLVALFVLGIALPGVQMLLPVLPERASFENRHLVSRPKLPESLKEVLAYPPRFEGYFNDHFGFRNTLISWNNRVRVHWLRADTAPPVVAASGVENAVSTAAANPNRAAKLATAAPLKLDWRRAVLGKEDWLFVNGGPVDNYYLVPTYTRGELNIWSRAFSERQRWLAQRGIAYVVAVCPNSHAVYGEFLPDSIAGWATRRTRADQLVEALAGTGINFLYLRDTMLAAKRERQVYYRTDHHWNEFGAYVGYREIMQVLSATLPALTPRPLSDFEITTREFHTGSAANILGLPDVYWEDAICLVPQAPRRAQETEASAGYLTTSVPDSDLPRAVIFHDSFIFNIRPFLAEHFSRARYAWNHVGFDKGLIEAERPQVVIQLFVEHRLTGVPGRRPAAEL